MPSHFHVHLTAIIPSQNSAPKPNVMCSNCAQNPVGTCAVKCGFSDWCQECDQSLWSTQGASVQRCESDLTLFSTRTLPVPPSSCVVQPSEVRNAARNSSHCLCCKFKCHKFSGHFHERRMSAMRSTYPKDNAYSLYMGSRFVETVCVL